MSAGQRPTTLTSPASFSTQPRWNDAGRQPVLRGRRGDGWRSGDEHPEDLSPATATASAWRRPVSGISVGDRERRRRVQRLNRVIPGMNGGWTTRWPLSRMADWKSIETTQFGSALQQVRYPPTRAAYTANSPFAHVHAAGAVYVDPEMSWRYEIGPSGATFVNGTRLARNTTGRFG